VELLQQDQSAVFPMGADDHPLKAVSEQVCDMVSLAQRQDCEVLQVTAELTVYGWGLGVGSGFRVTGGKYIAVYNLNVRCYICIAV